MYEFIPIILPPYFRILAVMIRIDYKSSEFSDHVCTVLSPEPVLSSTSNLYTKLLL